MVKPLCTVLRCSQNLLNNVADVIPHCAKVVYIIQPCDKDVLLSNYIMCVPMFLLSNLRVTCPWLSSGHLILDLHHARFSQDMHMSPNPPYLAEVQEEHEAKSVSRSLFIEVHVGKVCNLHPLSTFKSLFPWLLTGRPLLDLYHARFSQNLHTGHVPSSAGRRHRETQGAVR